MRISQNKRIFLKWWFAALCIYLLFAAAVTWYRGVDFLMPLGDDTAHHIKLAENLIKYRTFSFDGLYSDQEPQLPLAPTNFLTPGYALWLAFIFLIFKSFMPAIFIGALIFAFSVPLTYFLAKEITDNNKIAFWSAVIFMIEPLSVYHSGLLFTEQIFTPIFLLACFGIVKYFKEGSKKPLLISLFLFSFAVLIRPIIFYLFPLIILAVFIKESKISWKNTVIYSLAAFILLYSVIGAWLIRNKIVLDTWQISSNQGAILAAHYTLVAKSLRKSNSDVPSFTYESNNFSVKYNNDLGKTVLKELIKYKWTYLKIKLGYVPVFFIINGYDNLYSRLKNQPGLSASNKLRNDLALAVLNGRWAEFFKMSKQAALSTFLIGMIGWIVINLLALAGFLRLFFSQQKLLAVLAAALVLYFAFVASPFLAARYRLPINPFIFIFSITGLFWLKDKIKRNFFNEFNKYRVLR